MSGYIFILPQGPNPICSNLPSPSIHYSFYIANNPLNIYDISLACSHVSVCIDCTPSPHYHTHENDPMGMNPYL